MNKQHEAAVAVHALRKEFGSHIALSGVDLTVPQGEIVGLLGPNGAGKTTVMRILLGLMRATSGTADVYGAPYVKLAAPARKVGAVLDAGALHPARSGREHITINAAMIGVDGARVDAVMREVGLHEAAHRKIGGYSLGMRQRLALAAALLGEPSLLVLDEPANGLDPAGTRWLREYLRDFAARGGSVLISSHVLAEVSHIADEIVVITRGKVAASGRTADLTEKFGGDLESYYLDLTSDVAEVR